MQSAQISKESEVTPIHVPYGEGSERHLYLALGACRLQVAPAREGGEGGEWVSGAYRGYHDPGDATPIEISQVGGEVRISQGHGWAEMAHLVNGLPTIELALGTAAPFSLSIDTGAGEADMDLGGLPLTCLALKQGAGKVAVDFSRPSPEPMKSLSISSGASAVELYNLANANFGEMSLEGGAGSYKLYFGGTLRRDARVKVVAGLSSISIGVPANMAARISSKSVMGGVNVGDGFTKQEGAFWTQAALAGLQPTLSVYVEVTMGSLDLRAQVEGGSRAVGWRL